MSTTARDQYAEHRDAVTESVNDLNRADGIELRSFEKLVPIYVGVGAHIYGAGVTANQWAKWGMGFATSAEWAEYRDSVREAKGDPNAQVAPERRESFTRALKIATAVVETFGGDVGAMVSAYRETGGALTVDALAKWCHTGDTSASVPTSAESALRAATRKGVREGMTLDDMLAAVVSEWETASGGE